MAKKLNLSNMDFVHIKSNLKEYMLAQDSAVADYNFEGSAINTIIDILTYITHINAVNANMALNETFLDTAQLRESVVSHAKLLGYTPRSAVGARAVVDIVIDGKYEDDLPSWNVNSFNGPQDLLLKAGTILTTKFNGKTHNFIIEEDQLQAAIGNQWYFENVKIVSGTLVNKTYVYDETTKERYFLYDQHVDTSILDVHVKDSPTSSASETFYRATNIVNIDQSDAEKWNVYFIEESREGFYELKFGDGKIGKRLSIGNIIDISYCVVGPENVNGAKTFNLDSVTDSNGAGNNSITVNVVTIAAGGIDREHAGSIKHNAPKAYVAQNRCVTPDDYQAILRNELPFNIQTMSIWGGESNDPPIYGKVFISIKPSTGDSLTTDQEAQVLSVLNHKNIIAIEPVLTSPNYIRIRINVNFKFDPNLTTVSVVSLINKIKADLINYNEEELQLFGGIFRHSNVLRAIDDADVAVVSNVMSVELEKDALIDALGDYNYKIEFNQLLKQFANDSYIKSNFFYYNGVVCHLESYLNVDEGKNIIQIKGDDVTVNANVGYVDFTLGCIYLENFHTDSVVNVGGNTLTIGVLPASPDIKPLRNDLLILDAENSTFTADVDTAVAGNAAGNINYTTTPTY